MFLAKNLQTNELLAAKIQPFSLINKIRLLNEVSYLSLLGKYQDYLIDNPKNLYLFSAILEGNNLKHLFLNDNTYSPTDVLEIILASCYALETIHQKNVVHNDINEGNLMYNPATKKAEWLDMAMSITLRPKTPFHYLQLEPKNPPCHRPPETNSIIGYSTDIYRLGFLALRSLLILTENNKEYRNKLIESKDFSCKAIKEKFPDSHKLPAPPLANVHGLFLKMMSPEKEKRPSLREVITILEENLNKLKDPTKS